MKKILLLKHWQLFLLVVLTGTWVSPSPLKEIINMISVVTFTLWAYAIIVQGQQKLLSVGNYTPNLSLLRFNIILILTAIVTSFFVSVESENPIFIIPLIILSFYLVFAILYCIYIIAKIIKSIELNREAEFGDCIGYLLLIFFFFIGVWILQPKLNKIFSEEK
jgi:hypothetical protein